MSNSPALITVAAVGDPTLASTGGVVRSSRSVREYGKIFQVHLVLPPTYQGVGFSELAALKTELNLHDIIHLRVRLKFLLTNTRLGFTYSLIPSSVLKWLIKDFDKLRELSNIGAVVVLNEPLDYLSIGALIKEELAVPALALLQLPLFYKDRERRERIINAFKLWYKELYRGEYLGGFSREFRSNLELMVTWSRITRSLLENYDVLVAVSKSIPVEMGFEWENKFHVLDPGVSLTEEDLELMKEVRKHSVKQDYVVFGGRVDASKGFIEGLYVFKKLANQYPSLKLIVTSQVSQRIRTRIERFVKRIGLEGRIVLTGNLPRIERFKVVANARLMLYPSHMDSFSLAVVESLHLNTPVVAYDIPALSMYYGDTPGVSLVREGDIEALTIEAANTLEHRETIEEAPKLKSWSEIMQEEIEILRKLVERSQP